MCSVSLPAKEKQKRREMVAREAQKSEASPTSHAQCVSSRFSSTQTCQTPDSEERSPTVPFPSIPLCLGIYHQHNLVIKYT